MVICNKYTHWLFTQFIDTETVDLERPAFLSIE